MSTTHNEFGQIILAGWIGQHPVDFGDFPMLMAYTPGDGAQGPDAARAALETIVAAWGLTPGTMVDSPSVDGVPVTARLDGTVVMVHGFPGLTMERPTSDEWADLARKRGQVFFALATRPWPGALRASERDTFRWVEEERTINSAVCMLVPVV